MAGADGWPVALEAQLHKGRRVFLLYDEAEGLWHERYLGAQVGSCSWAVITPTLDVYVEELDDPEVQMEVGGPLGGLPRALYKKPLFRFDEAELAENLEELVSECGKLALQTRRSLGHNVGRGGGGIVEALVGGCATPPGFARPGLDASEEEIWVAMEDRAGHVRGRPVRLQGLEVLRFGDRGVVRLEGEPLAIALLGTIDLPAEPAGDLRVLPFGQFRGGAADFKGTVSKTVEAELPDWDVKGPHTVGWILERIAEQGPGPVHRHYWWRSVLKVTSMDSGIDDHLFLSHLLETGLCADGLNIRNLQCFEMIARRLQLWQEVYGQQLRAADSGDPSDPWLGEQSLVLGQRKSRGHALVAPTLEAWIAEKLAEESAVLKERRKGREERLLARGLQPPGAHVGGGSSSSNAAAGGGGGAEGSGRKGKSGAARGGGAGAQGGGAGAA